MAQPISVLGIALTHGQDLALGLVELQEVWTGPSLKPVKVPLDGRDMTTETCYEHGRNEIINSKNVKDFL